MTINKSLILSLLLIMQLTFAQPVPIAFEITNVNQIGLTVWNYGLLGNGFNRLNGQIEPSCQYHQYPDYMWDQVEHFSYAGPWIGGIVNGERRVSTAIVDGVFESGQEGFEFQQLTDIELRSTLVSSPYYHPMAISHLDIVSGFSDSTDIPNHNPLGIAVRQKVLAWDHPSTDAFAIIQYIIKNNSANLPGGPWDIQNLYLGVWVDAAVGNMNYTNIYEPGGGWIWYDNLDGFDRTVDENGWPRNIGYQYDVDGDDGWARSYIGVKMLGTEFPRQYWDSYYSQWNWTNSNNSDYPAYDMAISDYERYTQLSSSVPLGSGPDYTIEGYPNMPNSWLFLVSGGPYGSQTNDPDSASWYLPAGDSIDVYLAIACGFWAGTDDDSPARREPLKQHADIAQLMFNGEDLNGDGFLDPEEDLDSDGEIDRFILPPYPPQNLTADWNYPNVTLQWQIPQGNPVGYNIYKNSSLLNLTPVTVTTYIDTAVIDSGVTAFYIVSINDFEWVSQPSNTVQDYSLPPEISFHYQSNPLLANIHSDTSFTFPTRTFVWDVYDPDGIEKISNIYYSLDDTTAWVTLPGSQSSITLENIPPGFHTFFLKARDQAGVESITIQFPDPANTSEPGYWKVMPVTGNVLLVDDFSLDSQNNAQNWYKSVLDTIVGVENYSVWEIGDRLPYSPVDVTANLNYFEHIIWYSAYTGNETYDDASPSILSYIMNGGNIFLNVAELKDTSFVWFSIDSTFVLNPSGRFWSGRTLVSQIRPELDLATSALIAVRVKGFETFLGADFPCPRFQSLYRLQEPSTSDEWEGTPNVCGLYQFELTSGQCSGKVVLMSMPLHNGSNPLMEGAGSFGKFIKYLLEEEFQLDVIKEEVPIPSYYSLHQNFPNPFNPVTTIRYGLPEPSPVRLAVYDLLGREIVILVEAVKPSGFHTVTWDASAVGSGIYFYQLRADGNVITRKLLIVK